MVIGKLIPPVSDLQLFVQVGQYSINVFPELVIPSASTTHRRSFHCPQTSNDTLIASTSTETDGPQTLTSSDEPLEVLSVQRIVPHHSARRRSTCGGRLDPVADAGNVELIVFRRTITHSRFFRAVLPIEQLRPEEEFVS